VFSPIFDLVSGLVVTARHFLHNFPSLSTSLLQSFTDVSVPFLLLYHLALPPQRLQFFLLALASSIVSHFQGSIWFRSLSSL
jgi:hypothetical protein